MQVERETARGIVIRNDHILLIRRSRQNDKGEIDHWLSIPGGGVDANETPRQTVIREFREELGVDIEVESLLAIQEVLSERTRHNYFLCTIRNGEPILQTKSEEYERMQNEIPNTYEVEWVPLGSEELPDDLFWSYAEAYRQIVPFITTGREMPLLLRTEGDEESPKLTSLLRWEKRDALFR